MDHTDGIGPVPTISANVKRLRKRKEWTAKELGDRLSALGVPWDRSIVANLENGRRTTVSVVELLALALVLDVAPVHLLVPADAADSDLYQVAPESTASVGQVRAWIRGMAALPGTDGRTFWSEVPDHEFGVGESTAERREHDRVVLAWLLRHRGRVYTRDDGTKVFEWQLSERGGVDG